MYATGWQGGSLKKISTWSFKTEGVIGVWSALHQVLLGELGVAKVIIGREEKVKSESLKLKQIL